MNNETPAAPAQVEPTEPVTPPPTPPVTPKPAHVNSPGVIVLQWLSYAFWGWLILALIWLMGVIFINAISGASVSSIVPYAIASGIVLLPIAFVTDLFYRKHEPLKKTGAAMIIMVIHAVLFALLGIVSLIVAVFNGLNAVLEASRSIDTQLIIIYTALGATILYAGAFIRTLNPFKNKAPLFAYSLTMLSVTILLFIFAITGPFLQTLSTRDDRRIEQNLSVVSDSINNYITENDTLPTDLGQVTIESEDAASIVKDGLVSYKPETSLPSPTNQKVTQHRYQLCATFKEASEYSQSYNNSYSSNRYSSYVSAYNHGKGEVCYKVEETTTAKTDIDAIIYDL